VFTESKTTLPALPAKTNKLWGNTGVRFLWKLKKNVEGLVTKGTGVVDAQTLVPL
jgi:hypothetical protein